MPPKCRKKQFKECQTATLQKFSDVKDALDIVYQNPVASTAGLRETTDYMRISLSKLANV